MELVHSETFCSKELAVVCDILFYLVLSCS